MTFRDFSIYEKIINSDSYNDIIYKTNTLEPWKSMNSLRKDIEWKSDEELYMEKAKLAIENDELDVLTKLMKKIKTNSEKHQLLCTAIIKKNIRAVKILLSYAVNPYYLNCRAIKMAAKCGYNNIIDIFHNSGYVPRNDKEAAMIICSAWDGEKIETVKYLTKLYSEKHDIIGMIAEKNENKLLKLLIEEC